jgi:hypothetical protein
MCVPLNSFKDLVIKEEDLLTFILPYPSMLQALLTHLHSSWIPHKKQCYKATNLFHSSRTKRHFKVHSEHFDWFFTSKAPPLPEKKKKKKKLQPQGRKEVWLFAYRISKVASLRSLSTSSLPSLSLYSFSGLLHTRKQTLESKPWMNEWWATRWALHSSSARQPHPTPHPTSNYDLQNNLLFFFPKKIIHFMNLKLLFFHALLWYCHMKSEIIQDCSMW